MIAASKNYIFLRGWYVFVYVCVFVFVCVFVDVLSMFLMEGTWKMIVQITRPLLEHSVLLLVTM